ncbi:MAG: hypothetical protein AB7F76_04990 [Parvibaculaceae bacterium]
MTNKPVKTDMAFTGSPTMQHRFFSLSNDSFRGSLWAFVYCLMIVVACPAALALGVSRYIVAAGVLVVLPIVASLLVLALRYLVSQAR